jgi:hypothetical protein
MDELDRDRLMRMAIDYAFMSQGPMQQTTDGFAALTKTGYRLFIFSVSRLAAIKPC